jgi:hypothetical protein
VSGRRKTVTDPVHFDAAEIRDVTAALKAQVRGSRAAASRQGTPRADQGRNVVLVGPAGSGKPDLAIALVMTWPGTRTGPVRHRDRVRGPASPRPTNKAGRPPNSPAANATALTLTVMVLGVVSN